MSDVVDIEPEYPDVQVFLDPLGEDDLAVITAVVDALDRAGHRLMAEAFSMAALGCPTWDDLMLLIRCTVTVL